RCLVGSEMCIRDRRAETSLARNSVYPSLDAVLSYDRYGLAGSRNPLDDGGDLPDRWSGGLGDAFQSLGDSDYDAVKVGLVLEVPISNRSARAAASSARSALDQAQADVSRMRKSIRAEVLDAAAALETARQRIEAARSGREAAEVQLSAEQDRYAVGLSTNFLVLTRQNDLSRARLEEISALTAYRNARTEIARATGSLLDERDIDGREIE
ncbi:MAG: TolC family protein, partial [Candidatus Eisenbacteria bacterium]|nr:TolC family protein [Candidatus Eisenbacteria bacterium]